MNMVGTNRVILLTGSPGTGKTTLSQTLTQKYKPIARVGFGELLFELKNTQTSLLEYSQIRADALKLITAHDVVETRKLVASRALELLPSHHVIIDSHAVVTTSKGFRIIPEINDFALLRLDVILIIHAKFDVVQKRLKQNPEGRRILDEQNFLEQAKLQDMVAISYSIATGAPLYILDGSNTIEETLQQAFEALSNTGIELQPV